MVRKSKKIKENIEINEEIPEIIEENLNIEVEQEENADVEVESDIETGDVEEEIDEIIEDIEIKNDDIKEILNNKKKISEKQRSHLERSRNIMKEKEKEKKILMKKFNELVKLDINLDDVIENAKQLKIKRDLKIYLERKNKKTKKF